MSLTVALIIIAVLAVALLATLAFVMTRARRLRPQRQSYRGIAWRRARVRRGVPRADG